MLTPGLLGIGKTPKDIGDGSPKSGRGEGGEEETEET